MSICQFMLGMFVLAGCDDFGTIAGHQDKAEAGQGAKSQGKATDPIPQIPLPSISRPIVDGIFTKTETTTGPFTVRHFKKSPERHVWSLDGKFLYIAGTTEIIKVESASREVVAAMTLKKNGIKFLDIGLSSEGLVVIAENHLTLQANANNSIGRYWNRVVRDVAGDSGYSIPNDLYIFDPESLTPTHAYVVDGGGLAVHPGSPLIWLHGDDAMHVIDLRDGGRVGSVGAKRRIKVPVETVVGKPPATSDGFVRFAELWNVAAASDGQHFLGQTFPSVNYRMVLMKVEKSGIDGIEVSREFQQDNYYGPIVADATGDWIACRRNPKDGVDRHLDRFGYYIYKTTDLQEPLWAVPTQGGEDQIGIDAASGRALAGLYYRKNRFDVESQPLRELRLYTRGGEDPIAVAEIGFAPGAISIRPGGRHAIVFPRDFHSRNMPLWVTLPDVNASGDERVKSGEESFLVRQPRNESIAPVSPNEPWKFVDNESPRYGPELAPAGSERGVSDAMFAADGKTLFILTREGILHSIDMETLTERQRIDLNVEGGILANSEAGLVIMHPSRHRLIIIDAETLTLRSAWEGKKEIWKVDGVTRRYFDVCRIAIASQSTRAAIQIGTELAWVDLASGETLDVIASGEIAEIEGRPTRSQVADRIALRGVNPTGDRLIVSRGQTHLYDTSTDQLRHFREVPLTFRSPNDRNSLHFNSDGSWFVTSESRVYQFPSFERVEVPDEIEGARHFFGIGANDVVYFGNDEGGRLVLWKFESDRPLYVDEKKAYLVRPDPMRPGRAFVGYRFPGALHIEQFTLPSD